METQAPRELPTRICNKHVKDFLMEIERFHGRQAPGLVLGGLMVDLAIELLGAYSEPAAIVETPCFIPDAVQLFTPCTVGNGRLVVLNWGKMAICLYDLNRLAGYRIWLDLKKTRSISSIYNWHMHLLPSHERTSERVLEDILTAGRSILSWRAVPITQRAASQWDQAMRVCTRCDEACPTVQGEWCLSCQGESYYELHEEKPKAPQDNPCLKSS